MLKTWSGGAAVGRLALVAFAQGLLGKPYVWGQKGPNSFDCSGFVTYCLLQAGGPDWRLTHNAAKLFEDCPPIPEADAHLREITRGAPLWPCPGVQQCDLAFYGPAGEPDHVMMLWGDGRVIGASGGNHHTTSPELAAPLHAEVKFKDRVDYRPDFLGFRAFPFVVTLEG